MSNKPVIKPYTAAAGGWGATAATFEHLIEQGILGKGSLELWRMNKPGGFDCPGCGWPDPSPKAAEPVVFCENGAKALAWEATERRVTLEFFAEHTVTQLSEQSDYWLEQQGRLTHPLVYNARTDRYEPVTWKAAFQGIAALLHSLSSPDEVDFYTSGRSSNEAAFLYQLLAREFGTNNFPDCSNFCHEPTSQGLPPSIGIGKGTCLLEDFEKADAIFIFGQNPGTNSPRMMTDLRAASRRGARIVVFNPMKERALERFIAPQNPIEMLTLASTPIASHYYQVKVGGDLAALKGMIKAILEADDTALATGQPSVLDVDFIRGHTAGFDKLREDVAATAWPAIVAESGLTKAELEAAAKVYMEASAVIACYGMGITQHERGTQNVQYIVNLLLLRGNIGRPGAGVVPVRGHSNVQGDRTVGINERPPAALLDRIEQVFGFKVSRKHGHDVGKALAGFIHRRTEGNLLFMVTLLEHLCQRGLLAKDGGAWQLRAPLHTIDFEVPETLRGMIDARIERLSTEEQSALELASIAGIEFDPQSCADAAGLDPERMDELCRTLADRHCILRRPPGDPIGSPTMARLDMHSRMRSTVRFSIGARHRGGAHAFISNSGTGRNRRIPPLCLNRGLFCNPRAQEFKSVASKLKTSAPGCRKISRPYGFSDRRATSHDQIGSTHRHRGHR